MSIDIDTEISDFFCSLSAFAPMDQGLSRKRDAYVDVRKFVLERVS